MTNFLFTASDILFSETSRAPASVPDSIAELCLSQASLMRVYDDLQGGQARALMLDESLAEAFQAAHGLKRLPLRQALGLYDFQAMKIPVRGYALLKALEASRFCGFCGARLRDNGEVGADGSGRICDGCGHIHFPRISPAIIVLITKGPRVLVAHNVKFPDGRFGLIAGFVEAGETLEEAAIREAREEAGIEIGRLHYEMSQSWPFPDSLMLAFTAEWQAGEARPDGEEIAELRWCLPEELPEIPPKGSAGRHLLDAFVASASRS